ncbi:hypothetical protein AVEN_163653-1 [Araneus ventricosus]|uniref:Uncharacterized protein n=1 Tax=Araneus ventricosus TaxID=182803 RepID=A0A4Y2WH33_ARAVE|nr:hypothetical protein AVEN_163653-1 [Araneus ventricosus]
MRLPFDDFTPMQEAKAVSSQERMQVADKILSFEQELQTTKISLEQPKSAAAAPKQKFNERFPLHFQGTVDGMRSLSSCRTSNSRERRCRRRVDALAPALIAGRMPHFDGTTERRFGEIVWERDAKSPLHTLWFNG